MGIINFKFKMKLAVFAALTASVIAVCPDTAPALNKKLFTDDLCTTAYEPPKKEDTTEKTEEKTDDGKKEEPKEEPEVPPKPDSGKCEKYELSGKHAGYYIDTDASSKLNNHIAANAGKDVYVKVECSADSLKAEAFTDDKCESKVPDTAFEYEWGRCDKGDKDGDTQLYHHYSGAKALQVAAVAVLAFASSQF